MTPTKSNKTLQALTTAMSGLLASSALTGCMVPTTAPVPFTTMGCTSTEGCSSGQGQAQAQKSSDDADLIRGQYIVILNETEDADQIASEYQIKTDRIYKHAVRGFAGSISDLARAGLMQDKRVLTIEQDRIIKASASGTQASATWGLDRLDQRTLPLNTSYSYVASGVGVTAYIIDTGISPQHTEFAPLGRASVGFDAVGDGKNGIDCNGHGTHVAGTIGGLTYGVAKDVNLVGVRVLNCAGSGTNSGVIAGIDWVTANHTAAAVANMSLGGGASLALDMAVQKMIASGVATAVAAGNDAKDACGYSPARATNAMTVGATTSTDAKASYSNFGSCVDFFAPGSSITSSWFTNSTATNTISGTSMASPHVAGIAALYLSGHPSASPAEIRDALLTFASKGIVTGSKTTNNHLVHSLESANGTGDYVSPSTTVTNPINGSTVSKRTSITLAANASDNVGISRVEFLIDGSVYCSNSAAPYICSYKASPTAATLQIQSRAWDAFGNATISEAVTLNVR